jgi:Flp pilus assembly protein TadG
MRGLPSKRAIQGNGRRGGAARQAAAAVEFALVAPILFAAVIGSIEVGRAIMAQEILTNASREGARVAGKNTTTLTSTVKAVVDNYLSGANITGATTTVSPNPPSLASNGDRMTVTVSIAYSQVSWVQSPWFLGGQTLTAKSVMTRQP